MAKSRGWHALSTLALAGVVGVLAATGVFLAARQLERPPTSVPSLDVLAALLPGHIIDISPTVPFRLSASAQGTLLIWMKSDVDGVVHIDLCQQRALAADDPIRIIPLRIGHDWGAVEALAIENMRRGNSSHAGLRRVVLDAGEGLSRIPRLQIDGRASADFDPMRLSIDAAAQGLVALSDTEVGGQPTQIAQGDKKSINFHRESWLFWDPIVAGDLPPYGDYRRGLRIQRRQSAACSAGEIVVTKWVEPARVATRIHRLNLFKAAGAVVDGGSLPAGTYRLPTSLSPRVEDKALFDDAVENGLIRRASSGFVFAAPRDLPTWLASPDDAKLKTDWGTDPLNREQMKLLRRLYEDADGQVVRQQLAFFNKTRSLAALRIRSEGVILDDIANPSNWHAGGKGARISTEMPDHVARLFTELPQGWGAWGRIYGANMADPQREVAVDIPLPAQKEATLEILVIGHLVGIEGGRLLRPPEAVCRGAACRSPDEMQRLVVRAVSRKLHIRLRPLTLSAEVAAREAASGSLRIVGDKLVWNTQEPRHSLPVHRAAVVLYDRSGSLLYSEGTLQAPSREAGLGPILGAFPSQAHSVADILSRLGANGTAQVTAKLTLNLQMQASAHAILACIGYRGGIWREGHCENQQPVPEGRRAGLVLMDAATGDILAAAGQPLPPDNVDSQDLAAFDRANPAQSPLRVPAWQHDGGPLRAPGSTFKLLTALGLEQQAMKKPSIEALLQGLPSGQITSQAKAKGYLFDAQRACYPAPCDNRSHQVRNFRGEIPAHGAREGRLGLVEALTHSYNTWFAYGAELTDQSLLNRGEGGIPDVLALDGRALDAVRPVVGMAHRLGFEQTLRLDGDLLPPDFPWQPWDALQVTPAVLDPVDSRHHLRQQAIGLRMQATPLQMARIAAAVGEGRIVTPRLLLELNGTSASTQDADILEMKLQRLRVGMKAVVETGTARSAFSAPDLALLARYTYGKTGTAPTPSVGANLNTAWFVGWIEPGAWPGLTRRLAFASFVTHTLLTGGAQAAPIVAALLKQLAIPGSPSQTPKDADAVTQHVY